MAALIARHQASLNGQAAALEPDGEPTGSMDGSLGARLRSWPPAQPGAVSPPAWPGTVPPPAQPGTVPPLAGPGRGREPGILSRRRALTAMAGVAAAAGLAVAGWELAGPGRGTASRPGKQARGPGHLLWSHQTGGPVTSGAAHAGGAVYIGSDDGRVYVLDAASGHRIRTFHLGSAVTAAVTVTRGALFAATADGKVHALPVTDGGPRWTYQTGHPVAGWPAVAGGVVYVGGDDHAVYALDAGSKRVRWQRRTGGQVHPGPMPGSGSFDTMVYAGSDDGHVYAFDAQTGEVQWTYGLRGRVRAGLAQADPARVYAGDEHGNLYGLDALTGTAILGNWRLPLGGAIGGALVAQQDTVYAGTGDATGTGPGASARARPGEWPGEWRGARGEHRRQPGCGPTGPAAGELRAGRRRRHALRRQRRRLPARHRHQQRAPAMAVPGRRRGTLADPGDRRRGLLRQPGRAGVRGARLTAPDRAAAAAAARSTAQSPASQAFQAALTLAEGRKTNLPAPGSLPGPSTLPKGLAYRVYISMADANIWFIPYLASMYA